MTALLKRSVCARGVAHGADALEQVARQPMDLLIVDLLLPAHQRAGSPRAGAREPHLQDIPVMFCTANSDPKTVERALALGAVDFVKKPINVDAFAMRITRALKRAPARWESWREMIKRLRVDSRTFHPLLSLARRTCRSSCRRSRASRTAHERRRGRARRARRAVLRVRGASLNVGAIRTVQLIDFCGRARHADDVADLHAALVIELSAFDQALQSRSSQFFAGRRRRLRQVGAATDVRAPSVAAHPHPRCPPSPSTTRRRCCCSSSPTTRPSSRACATVSPTSRTTTA
jgi:CheY-like chemotaxis protein